jgi:hypothetical protein
VLEGCWFSMFQMAQTISSFGISCFLPNAVPARDGLAGNAFFANPPRAGLGSQGVYGGPNAE